MAPNIREMLVCEACGYIADRDSVLTEIGKGVHLKLRSFKCSKCDSLSEHTSNQKKDTIVVKQTVQNENDIRKDKQKQC